tara:strand:- start:369 stop:899 length:531 start_codon:yes stop_codon:yes gene_type:complete
MDNLKMSKRVKILVYLTVLMMTACNPALNWREISLNGTMIKGMFPCKPDLFQRVIEIKGQFARMNMLSCSVRDTQFALAYVELGELNDVPVVLLNWQFSSLGNIKANINRREPFLSKDKVWTESAIKVEATGQKPNGDKLEVNLFWFSIDKTIFQGSVYAKHRDRDAVETFSELRK